MDSFKVEYFIQEEDSEKMIYIKFLDQKWIETKGSYIFTEVGESIAKSSYKNICFDLSNMIFLSSSYLGSIMNIITKAKENGKNIKFRIHKECEDIFEVASIDMVAMIEVAK